MTENTGKFPCPCCGHLTMSSPHSGTYEICPVCYWEDDPVQLRDESYAGGANVESLQVARKNYLQFGACSEKFRTKLVPSLPALFDQKQFESDVASTFRPIATEFDYEVIRSDDQAICLESRKVRLHIAYDHRRSCEILIDIRLLQCESASHDRSFGLGPIYREFEVPDATRQSFMLTDDYPKMMAFLSSSCEILRTYCARLLTGDKEAFTAVAARCHKESTANMRQMQFNDVRSKANQAWKGKHYREFIDLLAGFEDVLTELDRKKLRYALKQLVKD